MNIYRNIIDAIGNTPLIRLNGISEKTGCDILGKAEFCNPGGSVKDRTAIGIIRDAEERDLLKPGGFVVEGTAGNTGIGLCLVGNALGYRTKIVIPETQSREKIDALKAYGAELHLVPAKPYSDPGNFVHVSERIANELAQFHENGAVWANQFDNIANRNIHAASTGPEIWHQTNGQVDGFVCSVGTGGTIAGVSLALKKIKPNIVIAIADPMGACLYHFYKHGELRSDGDSITEGIGQGRITKNLEDIVIDEAFQIADKEALPFLFDLVQNEGLCLGGSSGINVAGAYRLAKAMEPGHIIVTILADIGIRYKGRIYNRKFLTEKGLPVVDWLI